MGRIRKSAAGSALFRVGASAGSGATPFAAGVLAARAQSHLDDRSHQHCGRRSRARDAGFHRQSALSRECSYTTSLATQKAKAIATAPRPITKKRCAVSCEIMMAVSMFVSEWETQPAYNATIDDS